MGTVRTFRREVQDMIEERLGRLVESVALGFGATASLNYERMYPATINTPREAAFAADVAASLVGEDKVDARPDAEHGRRGLLVHAAKQAGRLPAHRAGRGGGCFLHSSRYDFNDEILPLGAALMASLVEQAMPL